MDNVGQTLREEAAAIAAQAGFGDELEIVIKPCPGRGGRACRGRGGRPRVELDPSLQAGPEATLRYTAAHEVGHVSCGHLGLTPVKAWLAIGSAVFLMGAVPMLAAGPAGATPSQFLRFLVALAVFFGCTAAAMTHKRAQEYEADAAAAALGHPLTAETAADLAATEQTCPAWLRPLATHPTWAQRLTAARANHSGSICRLHRPPSHLT